MAIPTLTVTPQGVGVLAVLDLGTLYEAWGPALWTGLETQLAKLAVMCAQPGATLLVRAAVDLEEEEVYLLFQYDGLAADLAFTWFELLADVEPAPPLLGLSEVSPGWMPMVGIVDGLPTWFVTDAQAPRGGGLDLTGGDVSWSERPLDDQLVEHEGRTWLPLDLGREVPTPLVVAALHEDVAEA